MYMQRHDIIRTETPMNTFVKKENAVSNFTSFTWDTMDLDLEIEIDCGRSLERN